MLPDSSENVMYLAPLRLWHKDKARGSHQQPGVQLGGDMVNQVPGSGDREKGSEMPST